MSGQIYLNRAAKASGNQPVGVQAHETVLEILSTRVAASIDDAARSRAARHVLDWLATAQLGVVQPAASGFAALARESAPNVCRAVAGQSVDWWYALQLNAALGNIMEMDDLHRTSILHPGPVIVPAAIAVAEKVGASGAELLDAIVRGYEATIRIGRALGTSHYKYFHNTSSCGSFGAAAAAASLLKLDRAQTVFALGNAGSRTGGLWQMRHEACETKSLHNVMAAQTGVQSALLAAKGVRGPTQLLEGPQGLFAATADHADPQAVVAQMGRADGWLIHDVSFKPWPACRHAHPAIDAALALAKTMATRSVGQAADIRAIEVATYKSAIDFCNQPKPTTEAEAKFSLQHSVAVALLRGLAGEVPQLIDFALSNLAVANVVALRERVGVVEDVGLTSVFPNHYAARLKVTMANGNVLSHLQKDAWGDPELPFSQEGLQAKFVMLFDAAGVEPDVTQTLLTATLALPMHAKVSDWTALWPSVVSPYSARQI
ncbi:MAG: MmgE/PrpD family protein [Burkholderiales bacterium]